MYFWWNTTPRLWGGFRWNARGTQWLGNSDLSDQDDDHNGPNVNSPLENSKGIIRVICTVTSIPRIGVSSFTLLCQYFRIVGQWWHSGKQYRCTGCSGSCRTGEVCSQVSPVRWKIREDSSVHSQSSVESMEYTIPHRAESYSNPSLCYQFDSRLSAEKRTCAWF